MPGWAAGSRDNPGWRSLVESATVTRRRPLTVLAAVLVAAVGCGESGPTKQEFIANADRICADLDRRVEQATTTQPRNPQGLVSLSQNLTRVYRDGVRRLDALELPADEKERAGAQRYIDSVKKAGPALDRLEQGTKEVSGAVRQRSAGQARAALVEVQRSLQQIKRAGDESDRVAKSYGFKKCGAES